MGTRAEFGGVVGRTFEDSKAWWPDLPKPPEGAPNVVIVVLDDVGYAQVGCYGSNIDTPCFDGLAASNWIRLISERIQQAML